MDGLSSPVQNRSVLDTAQTPANHSPAKPQGMDRGGTPLPVSRRRASAALKPGRSRQPPPARLQRRQSKQTHPPAL